MGKSKLKQQLKRKLPTHQQQQQQQSGASANGTLSKKQLKKQRREAAAAAAQSDDDEHGGNDGELREIEDLDFDDAFAAGLAFEQMESFEGALAAFQTAVKSRPDHLQALSHLADVYAIAELPQQALETYLQASKLSGADASLWFRLGITQMSLEQHGAATNSLKKSLALSAEQLDASSGDSSSSDDREDQMKAYSVTLAALANCCGEQGDIDGAVQVYTDAVAKFPSNGNLHYNLATMLMAKGDTQAIASLERAIECSPETIEFYEDLVEYLQQSKAGDETRVKQLQERVAELKQTQAAKTQTEASEKSSSGDSEDDDDDDDDEASEDDDDDDNDEE